ncbi:MAG TPA: hypothetical protein VLA19_07750 [Herpetosiphonaceae bacterium]|nr:hypothetical protein [Herpetosiphonaceae bacterium]
MSDRPLFTNQEAQEAAYAPQESADPEQRQRAMAEEGTLGENRAGGGTDDATADVPAAAPVASVGSSPSSQMSPPNAEQAGHGNRRVDVDDVI